MSRTKKVALGFEYDAVTMLDFGKPSPLPKAAPGEVVIRYGGRSLQNLCDNWKFLMSQDTWFKRYRWSTQKLPAGIYHLRVPVPGSNWKTIDEQRRCLLPGEDVAPVVLVATVVLLHYFRFEEDLLQGNWTRCAGRTAGNNHWVELCWFDRALVVSHDWGGHRNGKVCLSSFRIS